MLIEQQFLSGLMRHGSRQTKPHSWVLFEMLLVSEIAQLWSNQCEAKKSVEQNQTEHSTKYHRVIYYIIC